MIWIEAGILVVTAIIGLVTYLTAYRHRVVYAIETDVLRMPHGEALDRHAVNKENINNRLKSGEYTILQIVERPDKDLEIIYGLIKRRKENGN